LESKEWYKYKSGAQKSSDKGLHCQLGQKKNLMLLDTHIFPNSILCSPTELLHKTKEHKGHVEDMTYAHTFVCISVALNSGTSAN
jgi:hypothetical protein